MSVVETVATRCLGRDVSELNTGWEDTLVPLGLALAGQARNDEKMIDWARQWADYHLGVAPQHTNEQGDRGISLSQYCGDWGAGMVFGTLHERAPEDRWLDAVRLLADHIIDGSVRLDDGTIVHGHWAQIPWVDTLYYSAAPLARAYALTHDERYAHEAVRQGLLHTKHLRDPRTGCFFHEADPEAGTNSGWYWSRGNGWVVMAFADVLGHSPRDTPGWRELLDRYRELVSGLLRFQHPSGLWRIVPENSESHLETSGSIMIATGIAVGVAEGWLHEPLVKYVMRTWHEACTWVDRHGAVLGCQSPAGMGGWESHKLSQMGERTYGTGSFLRLAAELTQTGMIGANA